MAKQLYVFAFTVSSKFSFPMDMLRYDQCHPVSSDDVNRIMASFDNRSDGVYQVRLQTRGMPRYWQPTSRRWSSFLWSVDPQSIEMHPHID